MKPPRAADALLVGAAKLLASALVLGMGFRAVSDDDYARIVIAQRFAEAPSLDPSGTSWLPVPFWVYGSAFALFGNGLGVARVTALLLGVGASLAVLVGARWLGANRAGALLAALAASVFPWSRWLGAAALPEAPVAGLLVLGIAALSHGDPRRRSLGAGAIALACFSRYEAWPVAVAFAVFSAVDARRSRSWALAVPAAGAVLPIALWLAHGAVRHDDALFFWKRVAGYKHALDPAAPGISAALEPLFALVTDGLALVAFTALAIAYRVRKNAGPLTPYARGLACSAALLVFLSLGALGGGTPTHHSARALLPVWFFMTAVLGHAAGTWLVSPRKRRFVLAAAAFTLVDPGTLFRLPPDFAQRELELHIGDQARRQGAPALVVDTPDYGHLAVSAAFRRPRASAPLDDHDPRSTRPKDPFDSLETLRARLASTPSAWLVTTDAHVPLAAKLGTVRARNERFALVEP